MITEKNFKKRSCDKYLCPNSKYFLKYDDSGANVLYNMSINEENKINLKCIDIPRRFNKARIINIANEVIQCKKTTATSLYDLWF